MSFARGSQCNAGSRGASEMQSLLREMEDDAGDTKRESDDEDDDETHALLAEIGDEAARLNGCCYRVRSEVRQEIRPPRQEVRSPDTFAPPKSLDSVPSAQILPVRPKSCSPEPAKQKPDPSKKRVSWLAFCTSIYCLFRILAWGVAFVIVVTGMAIVGESYPQWWHSRVPQSWEVLSEQYGLLDALNASHALATRENISNTSGYLAQLRHQMPVALEEAKHQLESLKSHIGFLANTTDAAASPGNASNKSNAGAHVGYWGWLRSKLPAAWTAVTGAAGARNATNATVTGLAGAHKPAAAPPPGNASGGTK